MIMKQEKEKKKEKEKEKKKSPFEWVRSIIEKGPPLDTNNDACSKFIIIRALAHVPAYIELVNMANQSNINKEMAYAFLYETIPSSKKPGYIPWIKLKKDQNELNDNVNIISEMYNISKREASLSSHLFNANDLNKMKQLLSTRHGNHANKSKKILTIPINE